MLQNNDFTKAVIQENYLPDYQRTWTPLRFIRLLCYLMLVLMIAGQITTADFRRVEDIATRRRICLQGCQADWFPLLSCEVGDVTIEHNGNVYENFFTYRPYRLELDADELIAIVSPILINDLGATFDPMPADYQTFFRNVSTHGVLEGGNKNELLEMVGNSSTAIGNQENRNITTPTNDIVGKIDRAIDELAGWKVEMPGYKDGETIPPPITKVKNMYGEGRGGSFSDCADFTVMERTAREDDEHVQRDEICFSSCKRSDETADVGYGRDTRPLCEDEYGSDTHFRDLLCVDPTEDPDVMPYIDFGADPTCSAKTCFSWGEVLLTLGVSNTIQLIFETMLFWMSELDEEMDVGTSAKKCAAQVAIVLYVCVIAAFSAGPFNIAERIDWVPVIWMTWFMTILIDQVKNSICQVAVWYCITTRCATLSPGIQEYNEEYLNQWDPEDSLMQKMQGYARAFLARSDVNRLIFALVGFYAFFAVFLLVLSKDLPEALVDVLYQIDAIFIMIFCVEIVLKTFAHGFDFWKDFFNIFDGLVVVVSAYLAIAGERASYFAVFRLLRLMRVLIMVRKHSEGRKKIKALNQKSSVNVGSHVVKVLEILEDLQQHKAINAQHQDDLEWAIDTIVSNKLYSVAFIDDEAKDEKGQSADIAAWLQPEDVPKEPEEKPAWQTSKMQGNTNRGASQMRSSRMTASNIGGGNSRIGGTSAMGRQSRRTSRNQKANAAAEDDLMKTLRTFYEYCQMATEENHIEETLAHWDDWNFEALNVSEMIGKQVIPVVFCRAIAHYDFCTSLSMDLELLCNFTKKIRDGYGQQVRFHATPFALNMLQAVHYFMIKGELLGLTMTPQVQTARFTMFTGALIAHCGHPGFTNEFLVKTRHPRALRYNDQMIVQNHTLAFVSQLLKDPETNFILQWEQPQVEGFRKQLINMVLKLDIQKHFGELGDLNNKVLQVGGFPKDTAEDRATIMCFALRAADLSWTARPQNLYQRWSERYMDELFQQGDLEKQVGVSVSSFCDRDIVSADKCQLAILLLLARPFLAAFCMCYTELNKDIVVDGVEQNITVLEGRLSKETGM